jgi:uncharacterized protein DUF3291
MWTTEAAMKDFVLSGTHRDVMRKLPQWCDEAAVVHWTQNSAALPTWDEAYQHLQRDGRRSKVNHPSEAHTAYKFSEPRAGRASELRFR